jgi:uncharacterized DUF497 family protein
VDFEFDPDKSAANFAKQGIDFEAVQALWLDDDAFEIDARSTTEPRRAPIGMIEGKHWTAFFTPRGAAIHIISVRRAREKEARAYDERKKGN